MTRTNKKIHRPCNTCAHEHNCEEVKGCRQWKAYFRAYWRELRRKVLQ